MEQIQSYLEGKWVSGEGPTSALVNPSNEQVIAETSTRGLDFASALDFARQSGGPTLRAMTFAERGAMLRSLSEAVVQARNELLELSMLNNGATRSDAKFDVDGASFTLAAYAELGEALGDKRYIVDGEAIELLRSRRFAGLHIKTPRTGVAVHVNAYNFPAWGLAEKAAVALLAGMPVVTKPATATAYVAYALTKALEDNERMPLDFNETPLRDVVRVVSCATSQNIILEPASLGTTRFTFIAPKPVGVRDLLPLLKAALRHAGLSAQARGAYLVISRQGSSPVK